MANEFAQNPFIRTMWSLPQRLLEVKTAPKLSVSMSSLSQSYSHQKSGTSESINSLEGCLPKKRGSFLAIFGQAWPEIYYQTRVRINLTVAAQSFVWNIWLQETSLKMICASEAVTTFNVLLISQFLFFPYQSSKVNLRFIFQCIKHHFIQRQHLHGLFDAYVHPTANVT